MTIKIFIGINYKMLISNPYKQISGNTTNKCQKQMKKMKD